MTRPDSRTIAVAMVAMMLVALCACQHKSAPAPTVLQPLLEKAANVTRERLMAGDADQWLTAGRDANGTYYSPLKDINAGNVARLGFAWDYQLGTNRGQESTPLVIDGVMYATSNFGRVYALDATNGKQLEKLYVNAKGKPGELGLCASSPLVVNGHLYVGSETGGLRCFVGTAP